MTEEIIPEKRCTGCLKSKPDSKFYYSKTHKRRFPRCIDCTLAWNGPDYMPALKPSRGICPILGRVCGRCRKPQPWSEFTRCKSGKNGRTHTCNSCLREYRASEGYKAVKNRTAKGYRQSPWYKECQHRGQLKFRRSAHGKKAARKYGLKRNYNMTPEEYDTMYQFQKGRCFICGILAKDAIRGLLTVDHDHVTGAVRSLLCMRCNAGLGHFKDNPDTVTKAARYLLKHRQLKLVV